MGHKELDTTELLSTHAVLSVLEWSDFKHPTERPEAEPGGSRRDGVEVGVWVCVGPSWGQYLHQDGENQHACTAFSVCLLDFLFVFFACIECTTRMRECKFCLNDFLSHHWHLIFWECAFYFKTTMTPHCFNIILPPYMALLSALTLGQGHRWQRSKACPPEIWLRPNTGQPEPSTLRFCVLRPTPHCLHWKETGPMMSASSGC